MNWISEAACKGHTHLFFAPDGERAAAREKRTQEAVSLCKVCPSITQCAQYAADRNEQIGIWGGVVMG